MEYNKLQHNTLFVLFIALYCLFSCNNSSQKKVLSSNHAVDKMAVSKLADSLYHKKEYLEALLLYKKLLALDSNDSLYYFRSGYCEGMLFMYDAAIEDCKNALLHNYRKSSCYLNLSADYASIDSESMSRYYGQKCIEADSTMKPKIIKVFKDADYK